MPAFEKIKNDTSTQMKIHETLIYIFFGACFMLANPAFSQKKNNNKFYKDIQGDIYTKKQFDSLLEESPEYTTRLLRQEKRGDSTIIYFDRITDQVSHNDVDPYIYKSLPAFSFTDMDGNMVTPETLKGKIVYLRFWSVISQSCIDEIPELNRLRKKYERNSDVLFIAFCPDTKANTSRLLSRQPFHFTIIPEAASYFQKLKITDFPVNVFLDNNGVIRKITEGIPTNVQTLDFLSFDQYDGILQELLKKNKPQ